MTTTPPEPLGLLDPGTPLQRARAIQAELQRLQTVRDEALAEAERTTAGAQEVALMRATNARSVMGAYALDLARLLVEHLSAPVAELTVMHVRDPDGPCTITLWTADGVEYPGPWSEENIDAGAGWDADTWTERLADAQALPPSDYREELLAHLEEPPGSKYVEGWADR